MYDEELEDAIKRHPAKGKKKSKMYTVHTETGSVYDFDFDQMRMRRVNETGNFANMRQDNEWINLVTVPEINVGEGMRFVVSGLHEDPNVVTIRTTSYVVKVEEV